MASKTVTAPSSYVEQARQLRLPTREETLRRDPYCQYFWRRYDGLLEKAWKEWAETDEAAASLPKLDSSLYHPKLRQAVEDAWKDPSAKEQAVRDMWEEVAPDVFQCQFLDPEKIAELRAYLDKAADAGIPTRPPYGIVLNRKGFMLDPRSDGYMAIPAFQEFYRDMIDTYMRPLGRVLYPQWIQEGDDSDSFAFSINYQPSKDQGIREHTDASTLTLNINLNLPDGQEDWQGSSLYFKDRATGEKHTVNFAPGMAVVHRGGIPHAALPIVSGERTNLVLWLFGQDGHIGYMPHNEEMTPEQRWKKPEQCSEPVDKKQQWSPF